jgi:signal transducing adaptor molecule
MQNTNIPLGAQYSFGSAEFAGYGFSQNPYGPEFNQFQYQPPSAGFPQDAFYQSHQLQYQPHQMQTQPHQMQTQPHQMQNQPHQIQNQPHQMHNLPQRPYNIPTPHPHALNSMGPVWAPPE